MFFKKSYLYSMIVLIVVIAFGFFLISVSYKNTSKDESADLPVVCAVETEAAKAVIEPLNDTAISFPDLYYSVYYDVDRSIDFIGELDQSITQLTAAVESKTYTEAAVDSMNTEIIRLRDIKNVVNSDINKYKKWEEEHYYATKVWEYFMQRGYSEAVTCGIIGNMMIETSGGTLNLNPTIYSYDNNYYGLCQWSLYYWPEVANFTFEQQLEHLEADMAYQFNVFGSCYSSGFSYEDFINMEDPAEAALAFAKVYERCGAGSYTLRSQAALLAYNYFDLNT